MLDLSCAVNQSFRELYRTGDLGFVLPAARGFSPGDGEFLVVGEGNSSTDVMEGSSIVVLEAATGKPARWSKYLPLVFGGGYTVSGSIAWVRGKPGCKLRVLQAVVGNALVLIDVDVFAAAARDLVFTTDQLLAMSRQQPALVAEIGAESPHCVNARALHSGDTLLH